MKKLRVFTVFVIVSISLIFVGCEDQQDTTINKTSAYDYENGNNADDDFFYTGNGSEWCSDLFEEPASRYNNDLAIVAAHMSDKCESDNDSEILNLLSSYNLYACESYNYGRDSAHVIGQDTLSVNGEATTILVIIVRGTKTITEGIGDWAKGGTDIFLNKYQVWDNAYDCEEEVWKSVSGYLTKYPVFSSGSGKVKVLITGHSLGGAAAEMIGVRFNNEICNNTAYSSRLSKEDIYVYTFGAIKVLTRDENINDGYNNIHNIYNKYDSFGPYGNNSILEVSSLYAKFGHTDLYDDRVLWYEEDLGSTNNHNMPNYIAAVEGGYVKCSENQAQEIPLVTENIYEEYNRDESVAYDTYEEESIIDSSFGNVAFDIIGKWKNVGDTTFGQAQRGAIVVFNGTNCNYFSPNDTYAFYNENGSWKLDCTSMLFADTLSFDVEVIDDSNITISYNGNKVKLKRVE